MPNWCENWGDITHEDKTKMDALRIAVNRGHLLAFAVPQPPHIDKCVRDCDKHSRLMLRDKKAEPLTEAEQAWLDEYEARPRGLMPDWYDWRVDNWGTKWEVDCHRNDYLDGTLTIGFDSAWGPPTLAFQQLANMGFEFEITYFEGGNCFGGRYTSKDGVFKDEYLDNLHNTNWATANEWVRDSFEHLFATAH